jgi:DNA-directed RNA polymerase specialized sigma24 family protein
MCFLPVDRDAIMTYDPYTSGFRTTRWSLVQEAADDPSALGKLLQDYWAPMYAFVRRSGYSSHDAADVIQEFVAQRMLAGALLHRADPQRGRFRAFLKSSLRNFLADQHRRETAKKRSPEHLRALPDEDLAELEPHAGDDPSQAFDRQWVATLLTRSIGRVQEECATEGQGQHWTVFERVVLWPRTTGSEPLSLTDLAKEFGLDSSLVVSAMVQTVHRKFRRHLRLIIEETVVEPREVEAELMDLRMFLGLSGF